MQDWELGIGVWGQTLAPPRYLGGREPCTFLLWDWGRGGEPSAKPRFPSTARALSGGLCRDTQGTLALAEPLSDKAASPALAALGAREKFT